MQLLSGKSVEDVEGGWWGGSVGVGGVCGGVHGEVGENSGKSVHIFLLACVLV
jgi:hypothetical protein